jgi:hypothetical protein
MGLFDITLTDSPQYRAKEELRRVISECPTWQHLCELPTPAEAATKILTCPDTGPPVQGNFTQDQLASRFCTGQIWCPGEPTEQHDDTGNVATEPYRRGQLHFKVRRVIRPAERARGEQELYDHLVAAADLLAIEIVMRANVDFAPRISGIVRTSPMYASVSEQVAQGEYAWWHNVIDWGDIEGGGSD